MDRYPVGGLMPYKDNLPTIRLEFQKIEQSWSRAILLSLEYTARVSIEEATRYLSETKPGVNRGDGPRQIHPGGWADVTTQLVRSYGFDVEQASQTLFILTLWNAAEYAVFLERKGYWVLSGLFEGFIQRTLNSTLKKAL